MSFLRHMLPAGPGWVTTLSIPDFRQQQRAAKPRASSPLDRIKQIARKGQKTFAKGKNEKQRWQDTVKSTVIPDTTYALMAFKMCRENGEYVSLLRALSAIRRRKCTDPRDKVFAALGMAMDVYVQDIIPDYTKPHTGLYIEVAAFLLSEGKPRPLEMLGHVCTAENEQHEAGMTPETLLPSWVPNWADGAASLSLDQVHAGAGDAVSPLLYNATGNMRTPTPHKIRAGRLYLKGSFADSVDNIWSAKYTGDHIDESIQLTRRIRTYIQDTSYLLGGTIKDAFDHSLVADVTYAADRATRRERNFAFDWSLYERDGGILTPLQRRSRNDMLARLADTIYYRSVFQRKRGLLGIGSAASRKGDWVCLLHGGSMLYVLRPRDDGNFTLIGDCYVHKMMDGEATRDQWYNEREFVLV